MDAQLTIRTQAVLAHVTIFQLLDEYKVRYSSKVTQQIHCPVHKDRTPSARVYADGNTVYCFTCAQRWDVIGLVKAKEQCDFIGALVWLETRYLVPPASANLTDVVRAVVRRKADPSPETLYRLVEARLKGHRRRLGWQKYSKGLIALDLLYARAKARTITVEMFAEQARVVLEFAK